MTAHETSPRLEEVRSVGTRIRWGAILAGGMLALGLIFLLGILGAADDERVDIEPPGREKIRHQRQHAGFVHHRCGNHMSH